MLQIVLWGRKRVPSRLAWILLALGLGLSALGSPAWAEPLAINLLIDRKENKAFLEEAEYWFTPGYVYDIQEAASDNVTIRLDAPKIMRAWKGDAPIADGWLGDSDFPLRYDSSGLFNERSQFAPVLLVVDVKNISGRRVQARGAYLDIESSATDLEPFLMVDSGNFVECGDLSNFRSDLVFSNRGWGPVEDARLTYGFGDKGNAFVAKLGSFQTVKSVSVAESLRASGMDVDAVKAGKFKCPSSSDKDIAQCTKALKDSGLFGDVSSTVTPYGKVLLAHVAGTLTYRWTDNARDAHERKSPVSAYIPLVQFDTGSLAECGAAGAIERKFKTVKLPLDRNNYRIPLPYRVKLGVQQQKRFVLRLVAGKSSQHDFRVVFELADGTTVRSPKVNLRYFMPRFPLTN